MTLESTQNVDKLLVSSNSKLLETGQVQDLEDLCDIFMVLLYFADNGKNKQLLDTSVLVLFWRNAITITCSSLFIFTIVLGDITLIVTFTNSPPVSIPIFTIVSSWAIPLSFWIC